MAFTVSIDAPATHSFHVTFRCDGLKGEIQDFKMPVWMPGFYGIQDYAKFVSNFRAVDTAGHPLGFEKTTKNTWRVVTGGAPTVTLDYDVTGTRNFPAASLISETRAYLAPPGVYMHLAGQIQHPVTVTFQPVAGWSHIATGLDPVPGRPNTYSAPDFDLLYDSPVLLGNQEVLQFAVQSVPHYVVIENVPSSVDRDKMLADLKKLVEAATQMIGDIPYKHYTFLMIGQGNGGIEHTNSASIFFNGAGLTNANAYQGWLSYVSHEYFHNFNVKRIRPLALGPFDYDRENVTNMLWVSEGLSVYYQDLLMVRAGLTTPEQYLAKMTRTIAGVENASGHRYQSATESSLYTWSVYSGTVPGQGVDRNTTISYYDKGPALGVLLDLKIRDASHNKRSLDDAMRGLYRKYYQQKKRGFTDAEFQQECEAAAGGSLAEVFEYASTTKEIDYQKYFALAGLDIDVTPSDGKGAYLGLNVRMMDRKLGIASVLPGSPAEKAGLTERDEILEVEGAPISPKALNDALIARKPGDKLKLRLAAREVEVELGTNPTRTFKIQPAATATTEQTALYKDWLRAGR
jgi:predicted metalloprotease with PDZ domain